VKRLNVGCGTHYAEGWVNTDVVRNDATRPDLIVTYDEPFPHDGYDLISLSHILEHIPWADLDEFIGKLKLRMNPGCVLGIIGPDFIRCARAWKDGHVHDELFFSVAEHSEPATFGIDSWPGARHWWNCSEERVGRFLEAHGFTVEVSTPEAMLAKGWPVVGPSSLWQFAMEATL
jgi:predicted SAM-dependent methyltransferase